MPLPSITASRTPVNQLPFLFPGQAQKEAFVNEALVRLDALVPAVVLAELAAPPPDPAPGDSYLVAGSATGGWEGQERALAIWAENQWLFIPPREGARMFDLASEAYAHFTAAYGWQRIEPPSLPSGGTTQDSEARGALAAIVAALRAAGIFSA